MNDDEIAEFLNRVTEAAHEVAAALTEFFEDFAQAVLGPALAAAADGIATVLRDFWRNMPPGVRAWARRRIAYSGRVYAGRRVSLRFAPG
jgi:hypothetical protein